jgi:hypothetical protein
MGQPDINGNMYAGCELPPTNESVPHVTVRAIDPSQLDGSYEDALPDDAHKVIYGKGFYVNVTGQPSDFASGAIDVASIADVVGGEVIDLTGAE